jgi:hypothetical protein
MATSAALPVSRTFKSILAVCIFCSLPLFTSAAQDLPGSKDPAG